MDVNLRRISRVAALLTLASFTLPLLAQDRQELLETFVALRAFQNRLKLDADKSERMGKLMQSAMAEAGASPANGLYRLYAGFAYLQGVPWTPEVQFATAMRLEPEQYIVAPGAQLNVNILQLSRVEEWPKEKLDAVVYLQPLTPKDAPLRELQKLEGINQIRLPAVAPIAIPKDVAGDYRLIVKFPPYEVADNATIRYNPARRDLLIHIEEGLDARFSALKKRAETVRTSWKKGPTSGLRSAVDTAEYAQEYYSEARRGKRPAVRVDYQKMLADAEAILTAVEAGKDPLAASKGEVPRAYRSEVDLRLQPYRMYVPKSYDGRKATPLVVALHGMGADETSIFRGYEEVFPKAAEKAGYLLVAPKGRGSASMYQADAEKDVLDVIAQVRDLYHVDPARIYLMGHSMGAYGTWSIAQHHPELFAALAPIAGGGNPNENDKIATIPQYIVHGDADNVVNVNSSRQMVNDLKQRNAPHTYVEVPGADHTVVVAQNVPAIFEWFAKQARPAAKPAQSAAPKAPARKAAQ